ncbi:MAG: A/G-specific adenine glycosylase, partial [Chloroflexota bacterium]
FSRLSLLGDKFSVKTVASDLPQKIDIIQQRLRDWYHHNQRDLPWRGDSNPYHIWVSEVMLQQTQVITVIPYYHRFLERFPTIEQLATAPLDDVLKAWEGLGYYARARNLHKAAQEIVATHQGKLPKTYTELRQLPGFGEYTAGSVASIAFGQAVPAVDGNVKRVLARLFAVESDVTRGLGLKQIRTLATTLVDSTDPGAWTQTLMELGATVCVPHTPKCLLCPVHELCQGRLQGLEQTLPIKPAKKQLPHYDVCAAVIRRGEQLLIAQRPLDGMLGGMWEFPGGKQEEGETLEACLAREIQEELGVDIAVDSLITVVKHSYTHFKITLHAFECRLLAGEPQKLGVMDWRWVTLDQLDEFPFPRTDLKIIEALRQTGE